MLSIFHCDVVAERESPMALDPRTIVNEFQSREEDSKRIDHLSALAASGKTLVFQHCKLAYDPEFNVFEVFLTGALEALQNFREFRPAFDFAVQTDIEIETETEKEIQNEN